jgi:hypothetical protein
MVWSIESRVDAVAIDHADSTGGGATEDFLGGAEGSVSLDGGWEDSGRGLARQMCLGEGAVSSGREPPI